MAIAIAPTTSDGEVHLGCTSRLWVNLYEATAIDFVIPTGAQRSGGIWLRTGHYPILGQISPCGLRRIRLRSGQALGRNDIRHALRHDKTPFLASAGTYLQTRRALTMTDEEVSPSHVITSRIVWSRISGSQAYPLMLATSRLHVLPGHCERATGLCRIAGLARRRGGRIGGLLRGRSSGWCRASGGCLRRTSGGRQSTRARGPCGHP